MLKHMPINGDCKLPWTRVTGEYSARGRASYGLHSTLDEASGINIQA